MDGTSRQTTVEELLAEAGWLRRLALRLAGDPDVAEDAVQETWVAAMRRTPAPGESVRPWLATVLRNVLRMRARRDGRRSVRESSAQLASGDVPTPEALVARAELQRSLAALVLRLREPYRSTVLLHFCESRSLADIARAQGIPASTVRWRLKTALDQLRVWLDTEAGGRRQWTVALMAIPEGVLVAKKTSKVTSAAVILLLLLAGGTAYFLTAPGDGGDGETPGGEAAAGERGAERAGRLPGAGSPSAAVPEWLAQEGVEPQRIAGRVTFRGEPLAGATVELASVASESGLVAAPRETTDAAGAFDFGARAAMQWTVRASAPGKTGVQAVVDLRDPTARPPPDQLELRLGSCDAALFGTVRDASGGLIAGARLERASMGDFHGIPGGAAVETDDQGTYELCLEPSFPLRLQVEVSADGYGAIAYKTRIAGRVQADFALVPEATIVGRVVRDDTGEPIPEAQVFVPRGSWGIEMTAWRGTFTDRQGRFRLEQVAPGRHVVLARAAGMAPSPRGTPVVVAAGETTGEIEIRLGAGSVVRGVVREDGAPVAGARISALTPDGDAIPRSAVSQEDGSFVLEEVPRGTVRFTARPYEVVAPRSLLVERPVHDDVAIEVGSLGVISGEVTRGRRPVAGARIDIFGPNDGDVGPIHTDARGRFEARGLQPGLWTLFASSDREGAFGRVPGSVRVTRGETEEVEIELAFGAAIAGTVVDQNGAPAAGVAVEFHHTAMDDVGMAVTAADGSFRAATMVGGGTYRTVVRPGQDSAAVLPPADGTQLPRIPLADGSSEVTGLVIAVQLDRLAIAGQVVDAGGAPVADARVSAQMVRAGREPRFPRWVHHLSAITDVDGNFSLAELSEGEYALQARSPSGAVATAAGVRAGRRDVVLALPAPGEIVGTLSGFTGDPEVSATPSGGQIAPTRGVLTGSGFSIRDLSPGTYLVSARTATEAASARVEVSPGTMARVALRSEGTASVAGRLVDFRSGEPVQGMTCRALPRQGTESIGTPAGGTARSDARGRFVLERVPAGEIAVLCSGLWQVYSDGLRLLEPKASDRAEIEVPVVSRRGDVASEMAGLGAEIAWPALEPRLTQVRPGGPAASAGLRDGDVVIEVDGAAVTELSPNGVAILITNRAPGERVAVTVQRGAQSITRTVILGEPDPR